MRGLVAVSPREAKKAPKAISAVRRCKAWSHPFSGRTPPKNLKHPNLSRLRLVRNLPLRAAWVQNRRSVPRQLRSFGKINS
jgi:hypothetical protein